MKRMILSLILVVSTLIVSAHTPVRLCWDAGKYKFSATSVPSGIATIKVYSNSNYTGLIQTKTITVVGNTAIYDVNQPVRTTIVYVKVTWSDGYVNNDPTGTNQCTTQAIVNLIVLDAKNVGNNTVINFSAESTTDNEQITLNVKLRNGEEKHYNILILEYLKPNDIWVVTINNLTSQVLTVKKK